MPLMIKLNRNVVRVYLCLDNGHFITVYILGILEEVNNKETKKEVLNTLIHTLCPTQKVDITEQMVDNVNILEIDIQYMIGKEHIR